MTTAATAVTDGPHRFKASRMLVHLATEAPGIAVQAPSFDTGKATVAVANHIAAETIRGELFAIEGASGPFSEPVHEHESQHEVIQQHRAIHTLGAYRFTSSTSLSPGTQIRFKLEKGNPVAFAHQRATVDVELDLEESNGGAAVDHRHVLALFNYTLGTESKDFFTVKGTDAWVMSWLGESRYERDHQQHSPLAIDINDSDIQYQWTAGHRQKVNIRLPYQEIWRSLATQYIEAGDEPWLTLTVADTPNPSGADYLTAYSARMVWCYNASDQESTDAWSSIVKASSGIRAHYLQPFRLATVSQALVQSVALADAIRIPLKGVKDMPIAALSVQMVQSSTSAYLRETSSVHFGLGESGSFQVKDGHDVDLMDQPILFRDLYGRRMQDQSGGLETQSDMQRYTHPDFVDYGGTHPWNTLFFTNATAWAHVWEGRRDGLFKLPDNDHNIVLKIPSDWAGENLTSQTMEIIVTVWPMWHLEQTIGVTDGGVPKAALRDTGVVKV